jgi:hypothetical protein
MTELACFYFFFWGVPHISLEGLRDSVTSVGVY